MKLDALSLDDVEALRRWRNADRSHLRTPFPLTGEQQRTFYEDVVCNRASPHRYYAVRAVGELAACVGLTNISWENGTAEISLVVDPARHRHGVGSESVRLALGEAFLRFRLVHVWGEAYQTTEAFRFWRRLVAHGGYETVWKRRKFWHGRYYDSLLFGWLWDGVDSGSDLWEWVTR